jgi:hypothetical protein
MRRNAAAVMLSGLALFAACGSDRIVPPDQPPEPVELNAVVNIQLGDTPAGQQPGFIITGQVRAEQQGVRVSADVDSVVIFYQRASEDGWTRQGRQAAIPFSGLLPFNAVASESYSVLARLYARGYAAAGDTVTTMAQRTATAQGY